MTFERLSYLYNTLQLSDKKIAILENSSASTIKRRREKFGIKSLRQQLQESFPQTLTKQQDMVLIGTLMGDAHLVNRRKDRATSRLQLVHCKKQETYLEYKMSFFSCFLPKTSQVTDHIGEKSYPMVHSYTRYCHALAKYHHLFYPDGKTKTFKPSLDAKLLHPESLAFWYFDDGSKDGHSFRFSISKKMRSETLELKSYIQNYFGFEMTFRPAYVNSSCDYLRIRNASAKAFYSQCVVPHLLPALRYKIPERLLIDNPEPSLKGNLLEGVTTTKGPKFNE